MAMLRGFFQHIPQKNRKIFCRWFSNILFKLCRFWFRSLYLFLTHCQCGFEKLAVLENWCVLLCFVDPILGNLTVRGHSCVCVCVLRVTLEGWLILPVKSHWTMNISVNFCRTAKSLGWFYNNFLTIFIKLTIFDSSRAICVTLRGSGAKSTFGPMWMRKGPKNIKNFIGLLPAVALNRSKAQAKYRRNLH